jgi:hypothetical protein
LPRPARLEQRSHAGREGADALPALPRQQPASGNDLRRHPDRCRQQPRHRPQLRELPLADSRFEPPGWRSVPAIGGCDAHHTAWHGCRAPSDQRRSGGTGKQHNDTGGYASRRREDRGGGPATCRSSIKVDFGIRGTFYGSGSDEARYQRYRDFRDGGTIDLFRMLKETDKYQLKLQGDHIGYRDERFYAGYTNFGKLKASFEWNQIPLYYSNTTATLYDTSTPGQVLMSDAYQSGIQNKTLTLPAAMTNVVPFELRTRRDVAFADMTYSATPDGGSRVHRSQYQQGRRVSVGRQFRDQQRDCDRNAGAGRSSNDRSRDQSRVRQPQVLRQAGL